jgi:hypothetical protein
MWPVVSQPPAKKFFGFSETSIYGRDLHAPKSAQGWSPASGCGTGVPQPMFAASG